MIEFMQATFSAMQALYVAAEAAYNSGPVIMNGAGLGLLGFMIVMFVRGRCR